MLTFSIQGTKVNFSDIALKNGRELVDKSKKGGIEIPAIILGDYKDNYIKIDGFITPKHPNYFAKKYYCGFHKNYLKLTRRKYGGHLLGTVHTHLTSIKKPLRENVSSLDAKYSVGINKKEIIITYFLDNFFIIYFTTRGFRKKVKKIYKKCEYDEEMWSEKTYDWRREWKRFLNEFKKLKQKNLEVKLGL